MERVKWIFALCMILCVGCGSQVESEPTPTPTSTPSPTPTQRLCHTTYDKEAIFYDLLSRITIKFNRL